MKMTKTLLLALMPFLAFGAVNIPSGANIEINVGNLSDYVSGIVFEDSTGVVRFNLPSAPTMPVKGAGTLVKTSSADWIMTTAIADFTGDYILSGEGVVSSGIANAFGSSGDTTYAHTLTVSNGATLSVSANVKNILGRRVLVMNGTGSGGRGALEIPVYISDNDAICAIRLGSDARMTVLDKKYIFLAATGKGIDLNGHRLEILGSGYVYDFGRLAGGGELVLRGNAGGYVDFVARDVYFSAEPSESSPIVLDNHARLNFYNAAKRIERPLWVGGTDNAVYHTEQWPDRNPDYVWNTNIVAIGGPIAFTNETGVSNLKVYNSFARRLLTLAGSITGHGGISVTDANVGVVRLEGVNSTFDGGLYVNNRSGGQLQAVHPGSVGAYAAVTGDYGHVEAEFSVEEGDGRWTWADFADFAGAATWLNGAFPILDVRQSEDPPEFDAVDITNVSALGVAGNAVLMNADKLSAGFVWHAGKVSLSSKSVIDWSDGFGIAGATVFTNPVPGVVTLDGGVCVKTGSSSIRIGGYEASQDASATPRLVVKDAKIVNANVDKSTFATLLEDALAIGSSETQQYGGLLELHAGSVITNKLVVGGLEATIDPAKRHGFGGVWQHGGEMAVLGTSASHQFGSGLGMDAASQGGYELLDGRFVSLGAFQIGYYGSGVWSQYGGHALFTNELGSTANRYHFVGSGNGGKGTFYLQGGRVDTYGDVYLNASGHATVPGWGHLVISGSESRYEVHDGVLILNSNGNNAKGDAALEVNHGGVLSVRSIATNGRDVREGFVSFNGGTYRRVSDANPKDLFYGATTRPTRLTVYSGGMRVDTDGYAGIVLGADVLGPTGNGVAAIPMPEPLRGERIVAAPQVTITGDGHGATAVAQFDPISGSVTNLLVTSAGWDYSEATAQVSVVGSVVASYPCDLALNDNSGSFTKAGAGDLTLSGSNAWGGKTILEGGKLKLGSAAALPEGTTVELAGGTLDPGSYAQGLPLVWEVDALKALSSGGVVYDGDLPFPEGSTLRVLNLGSVPEDCRRFDVLKVSGALSGAPAVVDADGSGRKLRLTAHGLRADVPMGLCVIVR